MNKAQLVDAVARSTKTPKVQVEEILNTAIDQVRRSVKRGEDVTLLGFGTFTQTKRKERNGYHPRTGELMKIPAMTIPKFRPGREFKEMLN